MDIGILYDHIDRLRVEALGRRRRRHELTELGLGIAEHDHAVAKRQLGMGDPAALARHHHLLLEAERLAEPVDRLGGVAIAQGGDDLPTTSPFDAIDHGSLAPSSSHSAAL